MSNHLVISIVFSALFLFAAKANSQLTGDTIHGCSNTAYAGLVTIDVSECDDISVGFNQSQAIVGDGAEFTISGPGGFRHIDFDSNTVSIFYKGFQASGSDDLYIFTDLDFVDGSTISGLTLLTDNPLLVTTAFGEDSIGLLVNNPQTLRDTTVTFRIETTSAIPEPSSVFALAWISGLLSIRRRRQ